MLAHKFHVFFLSLTQIWQKIYVNTSPMIFWCVYTLKNTGSVLFVCVYTFKNISLVTYRCVRVKEVFQFLIGVYTRTVSCVIYKCVQAKRQIPCYWLVSAQWRTVSNSGRKVSWQNSVDIPLLFRVNYTTVALAFHSRNSLGGKAWLEQWTLWVAD